MKILKISILDKEQSSLERFKSYLNLCEFTQCVIAVNSRKEFLNKAQTYSDLDILFLEVEPEHEENLESIKLIKERYPALEIIVASWSQDAKFIFKALKYGIDGFLLKSISKIELERQLLMIIQGGVAITPSISRIIVEYFSLSKRNFDSQANAPLTRRENQIANLLFQGLTYPDIGNTLNISLNGVRYHIKKIYKKLDINSRAQIYGQAISF